jgi:hypothetical protein
VARDKERRLRHWQAHEELAKAAARMEAAAAATEFEVHEEEGGGGAVRSSWVRLASRRERKGCGHGLAACAAHGMMATFFYFSDFFRLFPIT